MNWRRTVIAAEHVQDAHQRGRLHVEVMPGDIITALARDTAQILNVEFVDYPIERPAVERTDGATALRRVLYRNHPGWTPPKSRAAAAPRKINKLALVGTGGVGSNVAHLAANREIANEIALIDVLPGAAEAIALDLQHTRGVTRSSTQLVGGVSMSLLQGADVIVVTAGRPRTPGMSRSDLRDVNSRVIRSAGESIANLAPNAVVIVVTNPVDEMTSVMAQATGFARKQVIGMAGTLDSARFRDALAQAAGVPVSDVDAFTLGSHGDEMVPIASKATIRGLPLTKFLNAEMIEACCRRTVESGAAVVALRKTGSATLAPAHATLELIEHIRGARVGTVPASVMLDGEYGIENTVLGVPCILEKTGVVQIVEMALDEAELAELGAAAEAVRARTGGA